MQRDVAPPWRMAGQRLFAFHNPTFREVLTDSLQRSQLATVLMELPAREHCRESIGLDDDQPVVCQTPFHLRYIRKVSVKERAILRVRCQEGSALSWDYRTALNSWGVAEINRRAAELIPMGPAKLEELAQSAKDAEAAYIKTRNVYVQHIASCVICSAKIVV